MKTWRKLDYVTPSSETVALKYGGIVCGSGDTEDYFRNNPANW